MEWGFHYAGPRKAAVNPKCITCLAGIQKECPTHGVNAMESCSHCRAARGGPCHGHWGLEAALNHYSPEGPESKADYEFAKGIVLAEPPNADKPNIVVTMRGDGSMAGTGHRELSIRMDARY